MKSFANHTISRVMRQAGATRATADAKELLNQILIRHARPKIQKAIEFSRHANRKTIKKEDIIMAISD